MKLYFLEKLDKLLDECNSQKIKHKADKLS